MNVPVERKKADRKSTSYILHMSEALSFVADKVIYLSDNTINQKPARARDYMTFLYCLISGAAKLWESTREGGVQPSGLFEDLCFDASFKVKGASQRMFPLDTHCRKNVD